MAIKLRLFLALLIVTCALAAAPEKNTPPQPFHLFDSMSFTDKPNLTKAGFERIYTTDREFFAGKFPNYDMTHGDEKNTRALARKMAMTNTPLVIDIEHWPIDIRGTPENEVKTNIAKLAQIVDWVHNERPNVKVGFYGLLPQQDYWTPVTYLKAIERGTSKTKPEEKLKAWQAANARLNELAEKVDFLCPSLYTFYDDVDGWKKYAQANIAEARKYGKPVYPFLWMQYHDSNKELKGHLLPGDVWKIELETCHELADGAVIWGGWQRRWNPQDEWWKATLDFLRDEAQ